MIAQRHDDLVERRVAGALAHAVDRHVHAVRARDHRLERIGGRQPVVVVAVVVEMASRETPARSCRPSRAPATGARIPSVSASMRRLTVDGGQRPNMVHDVVLRADHPAGPVFQIDVERDAVLVAVLDGLADVVEVLLVGFLQLLAAVMERSLRQQVDDADPHRFRPVDRSVRVDESENFDAIGRALRTRCSRQSPSDGAALAFARRAPRPLRCDRP